MHLLYPSNPLRLRQSDDQYAPEVEAVQAAGFEASVFSFESLQSGEFRAIPPLPQSSTVLYRGWMLSPTEYAELARHITNSGAAPFTDLNAYLASHHLPNWYPRIADLTPETRIFPLDSDLKSELRALAWPEFFIKDYVKSLKTTTGSRISKPEQIDELIASMKHFRGSIEGGFCVRRVENFLPESERRYFVLNGVPHAQSGEVPEIVQECASRLPNRFYAVDVIQRADGLPRIVEIGDGQVSDLVGWTPPRFSEILRRHFPPAT
jgi:hypothetical protein